MDAVARKKLYMQMSNVKIQLQHYITMSSLFYPPGMKWSVWAPGRVVAVAVGRRGCTWDGREARTPCMPETGPLWWAGDTSLGLPHSSHCLFTHRHVNINACSHTDTSASIPVHTQTRQHQYLFTHKHVNINTCPHTNTSTSIPVHTRIRQHQYLFTHTHINTSSYTDTSTSIPVHTLIRQHQYLFTH